MNDDFQKRVLISVLDFQLFILIWFFLLMPIALLIEGPDLIMDHDTLLIYTLFVGYSMFSDFKLKRSLAMRIYKYKVKVDPDIKISEMVSYEILGLIDLLIFPVYIIQSIFSDKRNRKLLKEKYTSIRLVKI